MTSKNSFSVSIRENQKRRIWAWAVSILVQIATYPGIMIIYLSRINARFNEGYTADAYKEVLCDAAADAVGFKPHAVIPILILGVILAMQGFSYLHDRKKVDMYHSVPVSMKKRFFVVYCNGIFIYLLPALICNILAWLIAAAQGAFSLNGLAECGMAFVGNFLYFLVVYHTTILAVMLTGNVIITACAAGVLLSVDWWIQVVGEDLKERFYTHADTYFFNDGINSKFCVVIDYLGKINELKRTVGIGKMLGSAAVIYAKWIALAIIPFILAYFCYIKRPAEAAGNAVAFRSVKPFVKIIVSVIVGLLAYILIEEVTYDNKPIAFLCMIAGTILCCALMEVIYDFDIRSAPKHLISSGIAAAIVVVIFCIHQFDMFGYDAYIPDADKVESVAIDMGPYLRYFEWEDEATMSIYNAEYLEDNMFITDVDAVCELVRRSYEAVETEDMKDLRDVHVLYRLKSGKTVSRDFTVNVDDPENEELLNRLIGSDEYKEGYYQIYQDNLPFEKYRKLTMISYNNGVTEWGISPSCAEDVREAWIKDMEQFDFSLARNNRVCGYLRFGITSSYTAWELPVYESFNNTFALLKEQNAYYPLELHAEDIQSLEIVNYHYDEREAYNTQTAAPTSDEAAAILARGGGVYAEPYVVTASFDDPEEIEQILAGIYPMELNDKKYWSNYDMTDRNYLITISFNADTDYHHPLGRGYYDFYFLTGEVPEFVVERTASTPVE